MGNLGRFTDTTSKNKKEQLRHLDRNPMRGQVAGPGGETVRLAAQRNAEVHNLSSAKQKMPRHSSILGCGSTLEETLRTFIGSTQERYVFLLQMHKENVHNARHRTPALWEV